EHVVFQPAGQYLVLLGAGAVRCLDAQTQDEVATRALPAAFDTVAGYAVANWGIALCGQDGYLRVHSIPDLQVVFEQTTVSPRQTPWLDPRERRVAFIDARGHLEILDISTGERESHAIAVDADSSPALAQVLLARDRQLAVVPHARGITIARLDTSSNIPATVGIPGYRVSACLDPTGAMLSFGAFGDGALRLLDLDTLEEIATLPGHAGAVRLKAFSSDGRRIITTDPAGAMRVWAMPDSGWQTSIGGSGSGTHALSIDVRRREVLLSDAAGAGLTHPLADGPAQRIGSHAIDAVRFAVSARGRRSLASLDDRVEGIDDAGVSAWTASLPRPGSITGMGFRPGTEQLTVVTHAGDLCVFEGDTGDILRATESDVEARISDLAWSGDGSLLALARRDGTVQLHDPDTLALLGEVRVTDQQLRSLRFTPDGTHLAAIGDDGTLFMLRSSGTVAQVSDRISESSLFCLSFHPEGHTVLVGDRNGHVSVVDTPTLEVLATLDAGGAVMSMEFTPDGGVLFVAALEQPIQRWDFGALAATIERIRPAQP
ncbi:MAG: WD40 repeat domain-containing protein, partial [Planctomycetota bacterium]